MFSMDFFRGENERLKKIIPQQGGEGGSDVKSNSPLLKTYPNVCGKTNNSPSANLLRPLTDVMSDRCASSKVFS